MNNTNVDIKLVVQPFKGLDLPMEIGFYRVTRLLFKTLLVKKEPKKKAETNVMYFCIGN